VAPPAPDVATYEGALVEALDRWRADVEAAANVWYPSYTAAYETAQTYIEPELATYVADALAARGLTMEDLNAFAAERPLFVEHQNRIFRERMEDGRPTAFAIMGRIDATSDEPPRGPVAPDATRAIASAAVPSL
jgi:hypothetical protein